MKRLALVGVVVWCVCLFQPKEPIVARTQSPPKSAAVRQKAPENPPAQWELVQDGVQVIRFWKTVGPTWPQIAILRLSDQKFNEFRADPLAFVNKNKIFPEPVRKLRHSVYLGKYLKEKPESYNGDPEWVALIDHMPDSSADSSSFAAQFPP